MRLRIKKKLSFRKATFFLMVAMIGFYAMFEKAGLSIPQYTPLKRYILLGIFMLLMTKANVLPYYMKKRRYSRIMLALIVFTMCLFSSAYYNRRRVYGNNPLSHALNTFLFLWELYFMIMYAVEHGYMDKVIRIFYWLSLGTWILTDLVFFYVKFRYNIGFFLIGTKFSFCYVHIYVMAFFLLDKYVRNEKPKGYIFLIALFGAYSVAAAVLADCMTGAIGIVLFVAAWILCCKDKLNLVKLISNPAFVVLLLVLNLMITFAFEALIQMPSVYNFITSVLGRSATMTGRLNIYKDYLARTAGHMYLGYGMGNANQICLNFFGYANTQNAILEWVIQIGVAGTVALLVTIVEAFRRLSKCKNKKRMLPFALLIYVFIVMGTVEITFSFNFFFWIAIIYGYSLRSGGKNSENRNTVYAPGGELWVSPSGSFLA